MMEHYSKARWGDLPIMPDTESGIAAIEREQITKPRSMELEGPQLHQPSQLDFPSTYEFSTDCIFSDGIVLETIKLVQHAKKLKAVVQSLQLQQENQKGTDDATFVFPPLPPAPPGLEEIFGEKSVDREKKICLTTLHLDNRCILLVLKKVVAIIFTHVGFEIVMDSVLTLLTEILQDFYFKLTRLLRVAVDRDGSHTLDLTDIFERVMYEMGIGSVKSLQSFHETRVVNYHANELRHCQQLIAEYEKMKQPGEQPIEEIRVIKVKDDNIAQIQFPVIEDQEELLEQAEAVIHLEELHGLHNIEHVPATALGDDEGPSRHDTTINPRTPTLDSDEEIIEVSETTEDGTSMQMDLMHVPAELFPPTVSVNKVCRIKKK